MNIENEIKVLFTTKELFNNSKRDKINQTLESLENKAHELQVVSHMYKSKATAVCTTLQNLNIDKCDKKHLYDTFVKFAKEMKDFSEFANE